MRGFGWKEANCGLVVGFFSLGLLAGLVGVPLFGPEGVPIGPKFTCSKEFLELWGCRSTHGPLLGSAPGGSIWSTPLQKKNMFHSTNSTPPFSSTPSIFSHYIWESSSP